MTRDNVDQLAGDAAKGFVEEVETGRPGLGQRGNVLLQVHEQGGVGVLLAGLFRLTSFLLKEHAVILSLGFYPFDKFDLYS